MVGDDRQVGGDRIASARIIACRPIRRMMIRTRKARHYMDDV
jgi:hypothetical protein